MTRALLAVALVGCLIAGWTLSTGASDGSDGDRTYWVELDNAFGLIEGADVKISGVRAGSIDEMKLDRDDFRALIKMKITQEGFGSLRSDATCETRPQSLIGEYFVDCNPGKASRELAQGATIPVGRTKSTVPVDLVNAIMRRPYRERFSILLSELGAGLAARGDDLNETIRRAVPALRETDQVLELLADQRTTIRNLYRDADTVLKGLADNREDVVRFVQEARDTSAASGERESDLRKQFARLPTFLAELQPTMRLLGTAAERQTPALKALNSEAVRLRRFLDALGPFAEASRPAFRSLATAARTGRPAVTALRPQVRQLGKAVEPLPEASGNLAITLEHLDDPKYAVEKDPRSPRGGSGYTGLEALLRYVFFQGQATNVFDGDGHILKVNAFVDSACAFYWDAARAKTDANTDRCKATLGPNRPGINQPDPTDTGAQTRSAPKRTKAKDDAPAATPAPVPSVPAPAAPTAPQQQDGGFLDGLLDGLIPDDVIPPALRKPLEDLGGLGDRSAEPLLDYLLGG
jgi:virulence factor Mce-like protein